MVIVYDDIQNLIIIIRKKVEISQMTEGGRLLSDILLTFFESRKVFANSSSLQNKTLLKRVLLVFMNEICTDIAYFNIADSA